MKALVVRVFPKAQHRQAFVEEMLRDARGSERDEAGCLMFNVAQEDGDPGVLHLFEVYADDAAVEAHGRTPHFLRWVEATRDWQERPAEVIACTVLHASARKAPR